MTQHMRYGDSGFVGRLRGARDPDVGEAKARSDAEADAKSREDRATALFEARIDSNVSVQIKTAESIALAESHVDAARRRAGAPRRESEAVREPAPTLNPLREDGTKKSPDEVMAERLRSVHEGRRP